MELKRVLTFLLVMLPLPAIADSYDGLYIFGDSLSDTHNQFDAYGTPTTTATGTPVSYYMGRYSNGPLWVEDLAPQLGLTFNPATDYAVAGATPGTLNYDSDPTHTLPPLAGIQTQVTNYLTHNIGDPKGLYIVWGGADDYLGALQIDLMNGIIPTQLQIQTQVATTVGNLAGEVGALASAGAHTFLIPNLGDLGTLPATQEAALQYGIPTLPTLADEISLAHDQLLATEIDALSLLYPQDTFIQLNVYAADEALLNTPGNFGFANVTGDYVDDYGLPGFPTDPNSYFYFDALHPSAAGHEFIAGQAYAALVPEPGYLGLLAGLSAVGVSLGWRRRARR